MNPDTDGTAGDGAPAAAAHLTAVPWRIEIAEGTTVEVDGTVIPDPEPVFPGPPILAVTVRMPGFFAHTLAHALAEWTHICELLDAGQRIGWRAQARALHDAARAAGVAAAIGCPAASGELVHEPVAEPQPS